VDLFRRDEREGFPERKADLRAEDGAGAGPGAIGLGTALLQDEAEKIVVLFQDDGAFWVRVAVWNLELRT
jgi:hypothetical protein